ncbi:MAG: helix-turn-helix family protein [Holophagaceae bacterium]|nr:helix-turn-helix family protein [Holophagaceae bacterium]
MSQETIGKRLKHVRMSHGWTQGELGDKLGVGQSQISRWERDQGEMWPATRREISAILGISPEWLSTGNDPSAKKEEPDPNGILPLQALRKSIHALAHAAAAQQVVLDLDLALGVIRCLAQETLKNQQPPITEDAARILRKHLQTR